MPGRRDDSVDGPPWSSPGNEFLFVIITCLCQVMVLSLRVRLSSFWTISHWCQAPQARTPSTYPLDNSQELKTHKH
ncbi:hypothetical protein VULLAG_LOCUS20376 [Vulpes lagopus]